MNAIAPPLQNAEAGQNTPTAADSIPGGAGEGAITETVLLDIWQRVLRVPEIGRNDNFFDLGGDSLLAVSLFLEIENQIGVHLPITAIYDAQSVAEMAVLLSRETVSWNRAHAADGGDNGVRMRERTPAVPGAAYASLVLLKPGTQDRPLFMVHGIGGTVIELAALGRSMRIPEAVYAIQARGLDGHEEPHETIEDMADHYVQAVRAIQPLGPYHLSGYSFGGLIATEMARRFKAQGQSVDALILIDAYAHPSTWPVLSRMKMKLRRWLYLSRGALGRSPPKPCRVFASVRNARVRRVIFVIGCSIRIPHCRRRSCAPAKPAVLRCARIDHGLTQVLSDS